MLLSGEVNFTFKNVGLNVTNGKKQSTTRFWNGTPGNKKKKNLSTFISYAAVHFLPAPLRKR